MAQQTNTPVPNQRVLAVAVTMQDQKPSVSVYTGINIVRVWKDAGYSRAAIVDGLEEAYLLSHDKFTHCADAIVRNAEEKYGLEFDGDGEEQ